MNTTRTSFLPQGLLLIVPVLILAGVGFYSLREDRALVEKETAERSAEWAGDLGNLLSSDLSISAGDLFPTPESVDLRWTNYLAENGQSLFQNVTQDPVWNYARQDKPVVVSFLNSAGDLIYPPRVPDFARPHLFPLDALQPVQKAKWAEARENEFFKSDSLAAMMSYKTFLATDPSEPFRAAAQYSLGLLCEQAGEPKSAREYFTLAGRSTGALTETGIPFSQLAACHLPPDAIDTAQKLRWEALVHPSILSPQLLGKADSIQAASAWRELWDLHQQSRETALNHGIFSSTNINYPRWFGPHSEWLEKVIPTSGRNLYLVASRSRESLEREMRRALKEFSRLPRFLSPKITLFNKTLVEPNQHGKTMASFSPTPNLQVEMILSNPAILYSQTSQRRRLFGTLIAVAVLTAGLGLLSAYTAFHRHLKLSQMKSNFVSSVSHELRAPIASMRLMSEALHTGRVRDAKQREYFAFITQECRRLSTLIENVLDVSRIEQNRKTYELAPANFPALVKSTVQIMEPAASESAVELLLARSARVNAKNDRGETPLALAAERRFRVMVQLLLDHGANPQEADITGRTPFHSAIFDKATLELMLPKISNIDVRDASGETPLHWAASRGGKTDVTALLLANRAAINATNNEGFTPLHLAVRTYCNSLPNDGRDRNASLPQRYATVAQITLLLEHKADSAIPNRLDYTPLATAIAAPGTADVVQTLLDHGANANGHSPAGDALLTQAIKNMDERTAMLLLEHKADPNVTDALGHYLISYADFSRPLQEQLIKRGADPQKTNASPSATNGDFSPAVRTGPPYRKIQRIQDPILTNSVPPSSKP